MMLISKDRKGRSIVDKDLITGLVLNGHSSIDDILLDISRRAPKDRKPYNVTHRVISMAARTKTLNVKITEN